MVKLFQKGGQGSFVVKHFTTVIKILIQMPKIVKHRNITTIYKAKGNRMYLQK